MSSISSHHCDERSELVVREVIRMIALETVGGGSREATHKILAMLVIECQSRFFSSLLRNSLRLTSRRSAVSTDLPKK